MVVEIQRPAWMEAARSHLERADELDRAGQFEPALSECRQAVEMDPSLASEGYMLSARLLAKLERPQEALIDYRKALRAADGPAAAGQFVTDFGGEWLAEATRVYEESDDYDRALALCEVALKVNPGCAEPHNLHGLLLEIFGESTRASVCYRRAITLDPTCGSAIKNLARLEEGDGKTGEEAIAGTGQETDDWAEGDDVDRAAQPETLWLSQWLVAFGRALFRPSIATFQELAINSDASVFACAGWLAAMTAVVTLFDILVLQYRPLAVFELMESRTTLVLIWIGFRMLIIAGMVMLFVYWVDGYQRWVFHGRISYYREILYVVTVVFIALLCASKVLALIPAVGSIVTWVTYAYLLLLSGIAVRGITGLSAGKAAATVIAAGVVMVALVFGGAMIVGFLFAVLIR